ncbi:MAG: endopeptidase La [Desulfobacterales bacterium]|nr:endopeptidase La [Desulfobacterales bacterium]
MAITDQDDLINLIQEELDETIPDKLPLLPVRDVVIFTDMLLPLFVGRKKSVLAVEEAISKEGYLFLAAQKDPVDEDPKSKGIYKVGTVSRVLRMLKLPDGRVKALVHGVAKGKVVQYLKKRAMFQVKIDIVEETDLTSVDLSIEMKALMRNVREHSEKILSMRGELTGEIGAILESIEDPGKLADLVASNLRLKVKESQALLEIFDPMKRLKKVNDLLAREVELSAVQAKIQSDVRDEISKSQRDYFLREQVRAIHKELGETDEKAREVAEYKKKITRAKMPADAKKESLKQLKRLEQMHPESAESSVVRTYLDWLVEMPWKKATKDLLDIKKAKVVLDKDHYGLEKVKDRILEYLSVRKLNPKTKGPILCFVGPPGVGKTSLGQSIARAMKRKFFRISLGGIRDEAEIRGHRRTYIGALPGRILQGLKQCGSNNPIFMMDEIDKLGSDFRGDPSSALLEALDPEQNSAFSDHYLNLPFDLSNVMFILTANLTDTIPSALFDRMETIHLTGYSEEEKLIIANEHLIPRQIKENGLKPRMISFTRGAIQRIISEYTLEAGLRNLERKLGAVCRKTARKTAEGEKGPFKITQKGLHALLGPSKYGPEMDREDSQVGLSTGLAWTQAGGELLHVEVALIGGKGDLIVTGQIGDVMQESARAAMSYARANLKNLGAPEDALDNVDVHIHVPAGAIPKDGPSAGIAMASALISALTERPVNTNVAMTGEITLRGRVLPIGGLKEKALGALRAGVTTVVIPQKNKKDLHDFAKNVKRKIKFITVKTMDEVLEEALEPAPKKKRRRKAGAAAAAKGKRGGKAPRGKKK